MASKVHLLGVEGGGAAAEVGLGRALEHGDGPGERVLHGGEAELVACDPEQRPERLPAADG
jgi:hypothetical protein